MKHIVTRRTLSLLLILIFAFFFFVGCSGGAELPSEPSSEAPSESSSSEPSSEDFTEAPADDTRVSLLDEAGGARYRVIRPEDGEAAEVSAGILLNKTLKELTGLSFGLSTDFLMPGESAEEVGKVYEILVGNTERAESVAAGEGLATDAYVISVTDYKIVIVGGSALATYQGVEALIAMLKNGEGLVERTETDYLFTRGTSESGKTKSLGYLVALTNQGESKLDVYDISFGKLDETSLVWSYKTPYDNIAGTKFRHSDRFGDVALLVFGQHQGHMVSYPEGKLLWSTDSAAQNPHSIELLPSGVIAIASSSGNEVRFFTTEDDYSEAPAATVALTDAHGVLWDPEKEVLWAVGRTALCAYRVTLDASGNVTVEEDVSLRAVIPTDHAHDLAPVYGDSNLLWISTGSKVYQYDKTKGSFSVSYSGNGTINRSSVKGIGNFRDGSAVFLFPDKKYYTWTTQSIVLMRNIDGKMTAETLISKTGHFYKARVWDTAYQ